MNWQIRRLLSSVLLLAGFSLIAPCNLALAQSFTFWDCQQRWLDHVKRCSGGEQLSQRFDCALEESERGTA